MNIYLAFDCDYKEDYDYFDRIFGVVKVPCTVFIIGSRHPEKPYPFPDYVEIGNHSYTHEPDWYDITHEQRIVDMVKNHQWLKDIYGIECKVFRSPHLRYFPETDLEMMSKGYKQEMQCAECTVCQPMGHAHLKQYFSSHHHFKGYCNMSFLEGFEKLCKQKKDFTFFLDPHHFTDDKIHYLADLIKIGKKYGEFKKL